MQIYSTRDGDTVDAVAWRQYGVVNDAVLLVVLNANPGLADRGPVLPAGVEIVLPDIPVTTKQSKAVSLWT